MLCYHYSTYKYDKDILQSMLSLLNIQMYMASAYCILCYNYSTHKSGSDMYITINVITTKHTNVYGKGILHFMLSLRNIQM